MKTHDLGDGFAPDVALIGTRGWLAVRVGSSDPATHAIIVHAWSGEGADLRELSRFRISGGLGFPRLFAYRGHIWLAYHDGSGGQLRNLSTGRVETLEPCENNDPICFGGDWVAWQGAARDGWPITRMHLGTGEVVAAGHGMGTGLSRILRDGRVVLVDDDRLMVPGYTRPAWAADLVVAEGQNNRAVRWQLPERDGLLWPDLQSFTPRCAIGDRIAIATWGARRVRLWLGSRTDLLSSAAAAPVPKPMPLPDPPTRPVWLGFYEFTRAQLPGNCRLPVVQGAPHLVLEDLRGRAIATYCAGDPDGDVDALERAIDRTRAARRALPVIAYWTRGAQRHRAPRGADIVGVEAYRGVDETLEQFEARVRFAVGLVPRAALICQCYTSNRTLTNELPALVPVYARIARDCPNVEMLLVFSGSGRATGYQDHPEVHELWQQLAASVIAPRPPDPTPDPQPKPTPEQPMIYRDYSDYVERRWRELQVEETMMRVLDGLGLSTDEIEAIYKRKDKPRIAEIERAFYAVQCPALFRIAGELHYQLGHKDVGLSLKKGGNKWEDRGTDVFAIKPTDADGNVVPGIDVLVDVMSSGGTYHSRPIWKVHGANNDSKRKWVLPPQPDASPVPAPGPVPPAPPSPGPDPETHECPPCDRPHIDLPHAEMVAVIKAAAEAHGPERFGEKLTPEVLDDVWELAAHLAHRYATKHSTADRIIEEARRRGNGTWREDW